MSSGAAAAAAEVIELSSDDDEEEEGLLVSSALALARRAPSSPPDVKPPLLGDADVKPLLLPPLYPPGYGALVPVKTEEPLLTPVPVALEAPRPKALPAPRLCRQFWKSGDYVVAHRNPDAAGSGRCGRPNLAGRLSLLNSCHSFDFRGGRLVTTLTKLQFGDVYRRAEPAADKPQVPALKCNFPQVGIWRYVMILSSFLSALRIA
jgi:hypothetical protein